MRTWILAACVLALAGCTGMLLGGAGSDGTGLSRDARTDAQIAADRALAAAVRNRLMDDHVLGSQPLRAEAFKGTVTLHGTVTSFEARERANRLAGSVAGVQRVASRIRVVDGT